MELLSVRNLEKRYGSGATPQTTSNNQAAIRKMLLFLISLEIRQKHEGSTERNSNKLEPLHSNLCQRDGQHGNTDNNRKHS
ncbi:hypothetical protein PoB_005924400 [Plakobranchus ocellatus]|uniref:Uncharacterized protein n=1 Tax=Plakobranchus ocellatus TaxID=259542 RepID=A0AAV4CMR1_9GAST|nr:hypothetical protein PoB_005924400 [Plakobranchus ocellatus]